jgi:para-aminobenzoate synthetase/4-amino-4-deoxychorismate lyase
MTEVVLRDLGGPGWLRMCGPAQVVQAARLEEVLPALREIEALVEGRGLWAAGFLSYEAAPAFDPALEVQPAPGFPLLWFALCDRPEPFELPPAPPQPPPLDWSPALGRAGYERGVARIKELLAAGETYQVNYTMRLRAPFDGDAWALFLHMAQAQPSPYAAFVDTGPFALCSASPELFFRLEGAELTAMPMKGTAPRGRTAAEDAAQAAWLRGSEKNRAENLMIVDMVRNDMGRVARAGSVSVPALFSVERHPTVWQMTSTVRARTDAPLADVMAALFPCASITGAPRPRTTQIIRALEHAPRRAYTGCIGLWAPGRRARFSVAIRTVLVDRAAAQAEYGVGSGVVWDSSSAEEYAECLLKARLLGAPPPDFELLETLRWCPAEGYALLERHLARLAESAGYFAFALDVDQARGLLERQARGFAPAPQRVRLLLARGGALRCEAAPLPENPARPLRLGLAREPVDSADPLLFHKTTRRQRYERALAGCPGCDDALLWNERGELTESCFGNLVLRRGGALLTPPLECGLLPGTMRAQLLDEGRLREQVLTKDDLARCDAISIINSVRGWRSAILWGEQVIG